MKTSIKNYSDQPCDNAILGEIQYSANQWDWSSLQKNRKHPSNHSIPPFTGEDKESPAILLILESPHTSEFKSNGVPIRPANGTSGRNLIQNLCNILNNYGTSTSKFSYTSIELNNFLFRNKSKTITIWILNSIQKQCSLGICPINNIIKESNWLNEWLDAGNNFVSELDKITLVCKREFFIINLCTKGEYVPLKTMVEDRLIDYLNGQGNHCSGPHPSSWGIIKKVDFK